MMKTGILSMLVLASALHAVDIRYEQNDPAVKFAAEDMARCLTTVTGKEYRSSPGKAEGKSGDILLLENPALQPQEWQFRTENGKLYISGRDGMGIVYGIYTFLEKYADCSWFAPDTELLPKNPNWKLPEELHEKGKPAFSRREMYVGSDYMDGIWRLRNKENNRASFGMNVSSGSPRDCHTFDVYVNALKTRPDLFGTAVSGRKCNTLCMTNPEVRRIILAELEKYIESDRKTRAGRPAYSYPSIYDISQPDGGSGGECWCDDCRKLAEEEGAYSGPNLAFVNWLAENIRKKYPELLIRTFAYSYTMAPPKKIQAADNVIVQFCRAYLYDPLIPGTKNGSELEKWGKHAKHKAIWSYWRIYQGPLYPFVKKRSDIAGELRFCQKEGVIHYFAENEDPLSRSFAMLQHWLMLKMLEDPSQDINTLTAKFLRGYYGEAAPVMQQYLDYLEKRQEISKQFLDREFFEKVNTWLDQAEELTANNPLARQHVNWERLIVDRSMYHNLSNLLKAGYSFDRKKTLDRFSRNAVETIENWKAIPRNQRQGRLRKARQEAELFAHFPVKIPDQFQGCEVEDWHWNQIPLDGSAEFVNDPDAVCGTAFKNSRLKHGLPFSAGFYFPPNKSGEALTFTAADIPQDEKFHLYKIGKNLIMRPLYVYFDQSWGFRTYLPTLGIIPSEWDIWVSIKFTGPLYVKGSKAQNAVLFDRMLLVKDPDPLRAYKTVDPAKNLVRNGSFEKNQPKWIDGWGKTNANCNVDKMEKHSGSYSLKIGNVTKGYAYLSSGLGKIADLQHDLLIRGWCKYEGLENTGGSQLPFIGIWTSAKNGRNSYTIPVASLYPGNREWTRFETVVHVDELKRKVLRYPEEKRPYTLAFRINVANQPGYVWLDDVEVLPLEKK